jgi:hypothetical protein
MLALRYLGHRCDLEHGTIKPWYFAGELSLREGDQFEVPAEGLTLGRGKGAGIRVASNGVARLHARVEPGSGGLVLRVHCLKGTNGTQCGRGDGPLAQLPAGGDTVLDVGDRLTLAGVFDFEVVRQS